MIVRGKIENLCCGNCAAKMQDKIAKLDGVLEVKISFITQKIILDVQDGNFENLLAEVEKIIRKIEPDCKVKFEAGV